MPVLQGDQPAGDIIGGILGTVGSFMQGQQQAKAQKAEQARQAALDAQVVAETMYRHAEDQKRDALAETKAGQEATTFTQGQQDREQSQATATALAQFQHKLQYPLTWNKMPPQQKIAYLQQRLNAAERVNDKQTIQATKDEIESIQKPLIAAANEAAANSRAQGAQATARRDTDVRESGALNRLNIRVETGRGGGSSYNSDLAPRAEAIENRAMAASDLKSALRIVEQANLPRRDRTEVRQDVMDQFRQPAAKDTSGLSNAGKEHLAHDMTQWLLNGGDAASQPDPSDPKYEKKSTALGTKAPSVKPQSTPTRTGRSASAPGKPTLYEYSDGSWQAK